MLYHIERDGIGNSRWAADGEFNGEDMSVKFYREHKRAIVEAGYEVDWVRALIVIVNADRIPVVLIEENGRRRVAAVLKLGGDISTDDDWIEIKQKR